MDTKFIIVGGMINAALFLIGVFILCVLLNSPAGASFAVLSAGLAYCGYTADVFKFPLTAFFLHVLGVLFAVLSAIAVIIGIL